MKTIVPSPLRAEAHGGKTRDDLVKLRDRISAATGPSVLLACDILVACGWHREPVLARGDDFLMVDPVGRKMLPKEAPPVTYSIDAAVTLVPDDLWWMFAKGKTHAYEPMFGVVFFKEGTDEQAAPGAQHDCGLALAICLARIEYELSKLEA